MTEFVLKSLLVIYLAFCCGLGASLGWHLGTWFL